MARAPWLALHGSRYMARAAWLAPFRRPPPEKVKARVPVPPSDAAASDPVFVHVAPAKLYRFHPICRIPLPAVP